MKLEPLRTEHLLKIEIKDVEGLGSARKILEETAKKSIAYTAVDGDDIIFIAGAAQMWPGVVEIWLIVTQEFFTRKKPCVRLFWQFMSQLRDIGVRRAQADIRADLTQNINFAKHFGFKFESEMKLYGVGGETYLRYVWFGE